MTLPGWAAAKIALSGAWLAAIGAIVLGSLTFGIVQSARLNGFHLWPVSTTGWIATARTFEAERDAERRAHQQTKIEYRAAQERATRLERERRERVEAQQQEITDAIHKDYGHRLADARTRAERLRKELQARGGFAGAGAAIAMRGLPAADEGSAAATADAGLPADRTRAQQLERDLVATEQAIQLDALIDWVLRQAAVDPNARKDRAADR